MTPPYARPWHEIAEPRVAHAAAALDAAWASRGGWAQRIDVGLLDLGSCSHCLLGQLYRPIMIWWQPWTWGSRRRAWLGWMNGVLALDVDTWPEVQQAVFASDVYHDTWIRAIADRLYPVIESPSEAREDVSPLTEVSA